MVTALAEAEANRADDERVHLALEVRMLLAPWPLRSTCSSRSLVKPHGYPGDYRMVEPMYDLEHATCADPTPPVVVNLLDGLFRSVHSVRPVWHRRAWLPG